jgi:uncharacterized protein YhbP (UPF0306 family)
MQPDVEQIVREYLPSVLHISLATAKDGKPWVCEVHTAFDDDLNLYFRSLATRRHSREIAENAHVAGTIVRQHEVGDTPLGVYFEGTAKLLAAGAERDKAYEVLRARLGIGQEQLDEAARPDGHQFYKISVGKWYVFGNLDGQGPKKYELAWDKDQA